MGQDLARRLVFLCPVAVDGHACLFFRFPSFRVNIFSEIVPWKGTDDGTFDIDIELEVGVDILENNAIIIHSCQGTAFDICEKESPRTDTLSRLFGRLSRD
ncbi:MAG: hypothetical protein CL912_07105 [Deltaproteobacteria bacterium]|nr:hypothetical protein [Deltaproteobacteria bacterium]